MEILKKNEIQEMSSEQSLPYQISNYPSGEKHVQKGQILNYLP